ncbi:MAG: tetratricopeptide repeat protein [Chloroflexi bacterium]|nr:tetratricopeptide repeat protein [Chloroflexota bacterium]
MILWRDPRLRLAFGLSIVMAIVLLVVLGQAKSGDRVPLVVGFAGVLALLQVGILLKGGGRQTSLLKAQQAFVDGRYIEAVQLLESQLEQSRASGSSLDIKALTVLGNTYRQLGRLDESAALLQQAVEQFPGKDFPVYGLGRTRLAQGYYHEAAQLIEQALSLGARKVIRADLALALYYAGADQSRIIEVAYQTGRVLNVESYRALMVNYLLYRLADQSNHEAEVQLAKRVMHNMVGGLVYWQGEAKRHAATDFGQRLTADVARIEAILKEENSGQ